jgi:ParB-like chromosome segregation protein Spo0J
MGMALAAELNGYPRPLHVIEEANALRLTADQRQRTQALFAEMKAETVSLGKRLIAEKARLDRAFTERTITPDTLKEATAAIGTTQAMLRAAHLRFHLAQVEVLSPNQTRTYNELRGYGRKEHSGHGSK